MDAGDIKMNPLNDAGKDVLEYKSFPKVAYKIPLKIKIKQLVLSLFKKELSEEDRLKIYIENL